VIRYPITLDELRARIEAEAPGWPAKAARRTERFRRAGRYDEKAGIWNLVKAVYWQLQHGKCAYCERCLADPSFGGSIEYDVDHHRPKGAVREWPTAEIARERDIAYGFSTGAPFPEGYYLLAYHVLNYAVVCKKCNSPLKASFFPVAGERGAQSDDPAALREERPFLLYPLGGLDDDPEEILTFIGINPVPRLKRGPRRRLAQVTIDFFELDQREELRRERALVLCSLYFALSSLRVESLREHAVRAVETLLAPAAEHASCARAFRVLYDVDRPRAEAIFQAALEYLESQSP
jgi:hypothetical protein